MNYRHGVLSAAVLTAIVFGGWTALGIAGEVTLETDTDCYEIGDTVSFSFSNGLNDTIWTPCDPPWVIWDATGDTLIYPSLVFWVVSAIDSNSSVIYHWDQDDFLFNSVSTGTYCVEISYSEAFDPWNLISVADTFEIKDTCGTTAREPLSWGKIKKLFR